jgi:hypothetical protein
MPRNAASRNTAGRLRFCRRVRIYRAFLRLCRHAPPSHATVASSAGVWFQRRRSPPCLRLIANSRDLSLVARAQSDRGRGDCHEDEHGRGYLEGGGLVDGAEVPLRLAEARRLLRPRPRGGDEPLEGADHGRARLCGARLDVVDPAGVEAVHGGADLKGDRAPGAGVLWVLEGFAAGLGLAECFVGDGVRGVISGLAHNLNGSDLILRVERSASVTGFL